MANKTQTNESKFQNLKNVIKGMSTKKKIFHFITIILAVVLFVVLIVCVVRVSDIHEHFFSHTKTWFENGKLIDPTAPHLIDGNDYTNLLNRYHDKGPEAIAWFLTGGHHEGGPVYITSIVSGILLIPTAVYTIAFHLIHLCPKKSKQEKEQIKLQKASKKQKKNQMSQINSPKKGDQKNVLGYN